MSRLQNEAGGRSDLLPAGVEHRVVDVGDGFAAVTHEVEGVVTGQVVDGAAVPEVYVLDETELGQGVECAIHGRLVDRWVADTDSCGQVVRCWVIVDRQQRLDHGSPWFGETPACCPQSIDDFVHGPSHAGTVHAQ